ncbi:MAG: hypothetical protein JW913_16070 [Chitinispirillaceae bacterium]|nr:hypothetical protein [Chitinispirillaceae bacterium]
MKFNQLVRAINSTNETTLLRASQGVNIAYTLRNWMIGAYIVEYEQKGIDRARYGDKLIVRLSNELSRKRIPGVSYRSLEIYKQFYRRYPQIMQTVSAQSGRKSGRALPKIHQAPSDESGTNAAVLFEYPIEKILSLLSFSHFVELLKVDDPLKRTFYELQAIKCNWNVRDIKRNIGSLLFERSALVSPVRAGIVTIKPINSTVAPRYSA